MDLTVLAILNAEDPKPVSTSTSSGKGQISVIRLASVKTSSKLEMPRSGRPRDPAETPPPDK